MFGYPTQADHLANGIEAAIHTLWPN